jgi:hypothetical protein
MYKASHVPWYRTSGGRVAAAIGLVLAIAAIAGVAAKVRADANAREDRRQALDAYADDLRLLQQELAPVGTGMMAAPTAAEGQAFEDLADETADWVEALEAGASNAVEIEAPRGLEGSLQVVHQAIGLYATAARTYELAATLEGEDAVAALARAAEVRDRASEVWLGAIRFLDAERTELGMRPAAVPPPADPTAALMPPGFEIESEDGSTESGSEGDDAQDGTGDEGAGDDAGS